MSEVDHIALEAFKKAWHEADKEGDIGNRTSRGLRAYERLRPINAATILRDVTELPDHEVALLVGKLTHRMKVKIAGKWVCACGDELCTEG